MIRRKVLVYVVEAGRLLVFRHVDRPLEETGLQVPGGSVEPKELPAVAALRELIEETGRASFRIERLLGVASYEMAPGKPEVHRRSFFLARATASLPDRWVAGEKDERFEFFWIPVGAGHVLAAGQGALLGRLA